jgi:CRISPR-associated protein Csm1
MADYYEIFEREIPDVSQYNEVNDIINVYIEFFEKYTWCIPSDTRYSVKDISLYDHIRTTTALAACLYKVHQRRIQAHKNYPKKEEFMFIAGDFSRIQNYIFDITNKGSGGASKRLRARSFFISIFCEAAIHKILDNLELPRVCNFFSAGGKFLLIAPNIKGIKEKLESVKADIAYEIHQYYFNQFSFLMTWKPFVQYEEEAKVFDFCKIADHMFHLLEIEKLQSSQSVFFSNEQNEHRVNKKKKVQAVRVGLSRQFKI